MRAAHIASTHLHQRQLHQSGQQGGLHPIHPPLLPLQLQLQQPATRQHQPLGAASPRASQANPYCPSAGLTRVGTTALNVHLVASAATQASAAAQAGRRPSGRRRGVLLRGAQPCGLRCARAGAAPPSLPFHQGPGPGCWVVSVPSRGVAGRPPEESATRCRKSARDLWRLEAGRQAGERRLVKPHEQCCWDESETSRVLEAGAQSRDLPGAGRCDNYKHVLTSQALTSSSRALLRHEAMRATVAHGHNTPPLGPCSRMCGAHTCHLGEQRENASWGRNKGIIGEASAAIHSRQQQQRQFTAVERHQNWVGQ